MVKKECLPYIIKKIGEFFFFVFFKENVEIIGNVVCFSMLSFFGRFLIINPFLYSCLYFNTFTYVLIFSSVILSNPVLRILRFKVEFVKYIYSSRN